MPAEEIELGSNRNLCPNCNAEVAFPAEEFLEIDVRSVGTLLELLVEWECPGCEAHMSSLLTTPFVTVEWQEDSSTASPPSHSEFVEQDILGEKASGTDESIWIWHDDQAYLVGEVTEIHKFHYVLVLLHPDETYATTLSFHDSSPYFLLCFEEDH